MVYVSEGRVLQNRPWGLGRIVDLFWGAVEFVTLFFKTLVGLDNRQPIGAGTSRGSAVDPATGRREVRGGSGHNNDRRLLDAGRRMSTVSSRTTANLRRRGSSPAVGPPKLGALAVKIRNFPYDVGLRNLGEEASDRSSSGLVGKDGRVSILFRPSLTHTIN